MRRAEEPDREHYVVKIGGSVLVDEQAYAYQAQRLHEFSEDADRIYAVLSARKGHTDELADGLCTTTDERESLRRLLKHGDYSNHEDVERFDHHKVASHLISGEIQSTKLMEKMLRQIGVYPETIIQGVNFPIIANGRYLNATLDEHATQNTGVLGELESKIVLVPGFGAQNHHAEKVLLGRNASDFVAALIGKYDPHVREVIYLKDVDGVYENFGTERQRLIDEIDASDLQIKGCGKVLDERCLEHMHGYDIRVQHCEAELRKKGTRIWRVA